MRIRRATASDHGSRSLLGWWDRRHARAAAYAIPGARVLLALKTALAVALAWVVAQHMPGVIDDYPYYAPLGALSTMYPTVLGSVRTGLQTLTGVALGLALAAGVLLVGDPTLLTLSLAVGIGVLLSGVRRLGAGAEYVPMAALFALIIGGHDAPSYSVGFLVQMAVGVGIGLVVNTTVFPPLDFRTARLQLARLQGVVVDYLDDIAGELTDPGATSERDWVRRTQQLARLTDEVREAVEESVADARINPRVLLAIPRHQQDLGYGPLEKLEATVSHLRDLTDVLRALYDPVTGRWAAPESVTDRLAEAVRATAACVRAWSTDEEDIQQTQRVHDLLAQLYDTLGTLSWAKQRLLITAIEDLELLSTTLVPHPPPAGAASATSTR